MPGLIFDTSALIHFANPNEAYWQTACDYYQVCLANQIPMYLSSIVAGEFHIKQPITDLPIRKFLPLSYELPHALQAARLFNANKQFNAAPNDPNDTRRVIINDLKIFAQAEEEGIPFIVSSDRKTLANIVARLTRQGLTSTRVLVLADGFDSASVLPPPPPPPSPLTQYLEDTLF